MIAAPSRVFIGRNHELGELKAALIEARSGHGRLCLITSDAGIGKTRLAEELAERARAGGARVLWGRGWEGGGAPGYWPWIQILRRLLQSDVGAAPGALARLVPELVATADAADTPPDSEPARFALFDAVAALLRGAAARRHLVLLLDDLHAADVASLLLLEYSARALRDANLAAYRARLAELRGGLDTATGADCACAAQVQAEIDLLTRELARGVGGRGRSRPAASLAERARLNVGRTIATAVRRVAKHHPALGRHLAATIHTGGFCSYTSDPHAARLAALTRGARLRPAQIRRGIPPVEHRSIRSHG